MQTLQPITFRPVSVETAQQTWCGHVGLVEPETEAFDPRLRREAAELAARFKGVSREHTCSDQRVLDLVR